MLRVGCLIVCLSSCRTAPVLVRVAEDGAHGAVEVAWVSLAPPLDRPPVILINMVHVGEAAFYEAVQARLERASTVLMEGVIREGSSRGRRPGSDAATRIGGDLFPLARAFRLAHQLDVLERRSHFVRADMRESEFRQLMRNGAEKPTLIGKSLRDLQRDASFAVFQFRKQHPELSGAAAEDAARRGPARSVLAQEIARVRDGERPPVMEARNRIALQALDAQDASGEVAICWGFAHGAHFLAELERRGYRVEKTVWYSVFAW